MPTGPHSASANLYYAQARLIAQSGTKKPTARLSVISIRTKNSEPDALWKTATRNDPKGPAGPQFDCACGYYPASVRTVAGGVNHSLERYLWSSLDAVPTNGPVT